MSRIARFDTHKALTATDYAAAFKAYKTEEQNSLGWAGYSDEANGIESWLDYSGVKPFIEEVARAQGFEVVMATSQAKLNYHEFQSRNLAFDRVDLIDAKVFVFFEPADITDEVMKRFWANIQSNM